jgi:hypothetical protein
MDLETRLFWWPGFGPATEMAKIWQLGLLFLYEILIQWYVLVSIQIHYLQLPGVLHTRLRTPSGFEAQNKNVADLYIAEGIRSSFVFHRFIDAQTHASFNATVIEKRTTVIRRWVNQPSSPLCTLLFHPVPVLRPLQLT